jgi:hypothetical protein
VGWGELSLQKGLGFRVQGSTEARSALRPTSSLYHISAAKGKVILCNLTSAKQSRLDKEGKKCNGTSAMLSMTSAQLLLMNQFFDLLRTTVIIVYKESP